MPVAWLALVRCGMTSVAVERNTREARWHVITTALRNADVTVVYAASADVRRFLNVRNVSAGHNAINIRRVRCQLPLLSGVMLSADWKCFEKSTTAPVTQC